MRDEQKPDYPDKLNPVASGGKTAPPDSTTGPGHRTEFEEQIKYERLLFRLSSSFVNLPADKVCAEVEYWLKEISEYIGADRSSFSQLDPQTNNLSIVHAYSKYEDTPWAHEVNYEDYPYITAKVKAGEIVRVERVPDDCPPGAEQETYRALSQNTKSFISIPFRLDDAVMGVFMFSSRKAHKAWPDSQVQRLNLIGEVFANALNRKQMEDALRESRARFKGSFDHAALGMIIFDPQGRMLEVNPFFSRLLGFPEDGLLGRDIFDITHPEDRDISRKRISQTMAGDFQSFRLEKRYLGREGDIVWARVSSYLVRGADGEPKYFISHVQDITESKKTSEKIKETNTALKVILDQRETEKIQQDKEMMSKLEALVLPYLEKLTNTPLDQEQKVYLELIRANLAGIFAPCAHGFKILGSRLTRTEMLVADMVKKGQTSQEIADLLRISVPAVYFHRNNIRQKLGLRGSRANLNSYLHSLD